MHNYKLKLTALTPIHIGTGEAYEPTNFVIDNGFLYEFDEVTFFKHLPAQGKSQIKQISNMQTENGNELFEKMHSLILKYKKYAIDVSFNKVEVSQALESYYLKNIAKAVQIEGIGKNTRSVFNKFEIQKTQKLTNNLLSILTGSSLKGSISTAYQENVFKEQGENGLRNFNQNIIFKNLSISDTIAQKSTLKIGYAVNKEIFEIDNDAEISTLIEANAKNSQYLTTITTKNLKGEDNRDLENITQEKIIKACNEHYIPIYKEKENKKITLKENQFLISVGKHSGARAVTIDGLRKILVKLAQISNKKDEGDDPDKRIERLYKKSHFEAQEIKELFALEKLLNDKERKIWQEGKDFVDNPSNLEDRVRNERKVTINSILTQETTIWKFGNSKNDTDLESFGWLLCEFIEEEKFKELKKEFKEYENKIIEERLKTRKKILEKIQKEKENALRENRKKEEQKLKEQKEEEEKKIEEQKRLASLSPLELKIDNFIKENPNKTLNDTVIIFQKIKDGSLDDFKKEALEFLKIKMQENNEWVTQSKKPQKDKKYKRTLEVQNLIKEL